MRRALVTWSDAGIDGPKPAHQGPRPASDRGPVLRLLEEGDARYEAIHVLTIPAGERRARALAKQAAELAAAVEVTVLAASDPSDYGQLFRALGPFVASMLLGKPRGEWEIDVLLSAGTPQAQTLWVILVQSGTLPARMLQVIPAAFVTPAHPKAVREVRLDIEGFPEIRALRAEIVRLRAEAQTRAGELVGQSAPMLELGARIARVAATDVPVLILGETGTGKELVARALHDGGERAKGPFIAENCGAFSEGVLASELFGHEAGAFTGAAGRRRGLFEQAHGGTLLLDEVGELAPHVQATLLRVLQEGTLRRVGGEGRLRVDVRIIAATHRDLEAMVRDDTFREDLYYRLRGATIEVPPLRARTGDLDLLVDHFLSEARGRRSRRRLTVTREAMRALSLYAWPGNVRELRSEVLRWGVFCDETVDVGDLAPEIRARRKPSPAPAPEARVEPLADAVRAAEERAVAAAMKSTQGNIARAARALGVDRNTLKRKLALFGMAPR